MKRLLLLIFALLLTLPTLSRAEDAPAIAEGALPCEYTVPEEVEFYVSHLSDGDPFTTVSLYPDESIEMEIPYGARMLYLDFYEANSVYTLTVYGADNRIISSVRRTSSVGILRVPVDETAERAKIVSESRFLVLSDWYAVADESVLPFPDTDGHADVLVVLNTPGDELLKLGGLLPMLCKEHGLSAKILYLNGGDGYHAHQCMQVLQAMGIRVAPYFGTGSNATVKGEKAALKALGLSENQLRRLLTTEIRTCRPQILITLDPNSPKSAYMDGFIARSVIEAFGFAQDAARYSEYETYTVSKLYTLSDTGETVFDASQPLYAYDGEAGDAVADELYRFYLEERMFRRKTPDTVRFTLQRSSVGEDVKKDDLLENLSTDVFPEYRCPMPSPEPTPEPTPTPMPTAAPSEPEQQPPTEEPNPDGSDAEQTGSETPQKLWWIPGVIGTAAAMIVWFATSEQPMKKRLWALAPLLLGILLSILLRNGAFTRESVQMTAAENTMTPSPTAVPTPAPTETPSPEPTEEPTPEPTPDPDDAYFLSGDGEEFELDWDNGHWWYKSSTLAIDIREVHTTQQEGKPLVYYVADIRMREYSSYRSGVRTPVMPWVYARLENAVLAITGDNLIDAEKELKGCLIRQGKFYFNSGKSETLVIKGMELSVLPMFGASERVLMDHGVRDTYGFGPTLVENGAISDVQKNHHVDHPNPRCGIGMVEPGHWVAIATEGRQYDFSYSITLDFFAQMFIDYGCTVAFNMDGGSSVGIVFMGEALNRHYKPGTVDIQRKWTDALLFGYSEQIPSPDTPTIHDGYRHGF